MSAPCPPFPELFLPVFSPFDVVPYALVRIIYRQFGHKIDDTDNTGIADTFIECSAGIAAEKDKEDDEHRTGGKYSIREGFGKAAPWCIFQIINICVGSMTSGC